MKTQSSLSRSEVVKLAALKWKCPKRDVTIGHNPTAPIYDSDESETARAIADECRHYQRKLTNGLGHIDIKRLRKSPPGKTRGRQDGPLDVDLVTAQAIACYKRWTKPRKPRKPSRFDQKTDEEIKASQEKRIREALLMTAKLTPANIRRAAPKVVAKINDLYRRAEAVNPGCVNLCHRHRWDIGHIDPAIRMFNMICGSGDTLESAARKAGLIE